MSLFDVTVNDSAYAEKTTGRARISDNNEAITAFLLANEPLVWYNMLLPSNTLAWHYIRNPWNGRSTFYCGKKPEMWRYLPPSTLKRNNAALALPARCAPNTTLIG